MSLRLAYFTEQIVFTFYPYVSKFQKQTKLVSSRTVSKIQQSSVHGTRVSCLPSALSTLCTPLLASCSWQCVDACLLTSVCCWHCSVSLHRCIVAHTVVSGQSESPMLCLTILSFPSVPESHHAFYCLHKLAFSRSDSCSHEVYGPIPSNVSYFMSWELSPTPS